MTDASAIFNLFLFSILPYLVLVNFFILTIVRYRRTPFTYSSLSSQFLENRKQFWGSTAFHIGIVGVLLGHLLGLLIPSQVLAWNGRPMRLYVLEGTGLLLAIMAMSGLIALVYRRVTATKIRLVTTKTDWAVLAILIVQIVTGLYTAIFVPWGSSWFAASAVPYLYSVFLFRPDPSYLATFPWSVKLHILNAWIFLGIFPYTRLVHLLVAPLPYLWRKPQVVRWRGVRGNEETRGPNPWLPKRPPHLVTKR